MPGASHIRLSPACSPLARGALVVVLALVLGACRRGEPSLSIGDPVSLAWTLAQDAPRTPEGSRLIGQLTLDVVVTGGPARTQVEHETELRALLTRLLEAELAVERAPEELLPRLRELAPEPLTSGGWRLERLEGALSLPGGVRRPDLVPTTDLRVLLVGLDGHDWDIARPLMEAGRLPVLSKLVDGGVSGRLASLEPLLSPVVWTSIATGCRPEEHGILDFLGVSASGQPVPVTSNLRKRRAFWNVLSEAGVDVGVVAWWASWPAEPVEGFLVSDRVAYQTFGGFKSSPAVGLVHPPVLWKELAGQRVRPEEIGPSELGRFHDASVREGWTREDDRLLKDLREKLASAKSYARMSVNLHREERPRVGAYYYQLPDQVAHLFMRYADPPLPEVDPNRQRRFRRAVTAAYERHDQLLGELLSEADERTVVMVVSDHGFRTGRERPSTASRVESPTAADWHARFGIIAMSGPAVRAGVVIEEATVLDVFPTLLALLGMPVAEDLAGRVLEEALTEEFLAAHPVRTVESFETEPLRSATPVGAAPGDEALLESLMAIGYVGGAPATSSGTDDGGSEGAGADPVHAANAHNNRATIHLGLGEIEQARVELAAALALSPDFHQARLNLARVHLRQGDDDAAAKELAEVLTRSPGHVAALSLRSEVELGRGRLDAAEADVRAAIESQPRHAASWHQLGRIQEVRRSLDEAVSSFETAAELDPENPEPRNALGNLHAAAGRHQQALVEYEAAVTADPHFAPAHANLALQCQRLGDFQRAFQVYERARESLPSSSILLNNLASLHHLLARQARQVGHPSEVQHVADARRLYAEAREADPLDPDPINNSGGLEEEFGQLATAQALYAEALRLNPTGVDAVMNLAGSLARERRFDEARERLQAFLELSPGAMDVRQLLERIDLVVARIADPEGALAMLEAQLSERSTDPDFLFELAALYEETGRLEQACRSFQAAQLLRPEDPRFQAQARRACRLSESRDGPSGR